MKKTTRNYIWILVANFLLVAAVGGVWQFRMNGTAWASSPKPVLEGVFKNVTVLGKPKPLKSAVYLANFEKDTDIADLKGQWTILNLWATWCPPCVLELPSLQKLAEARAARGLRVVAISLDDAESAAALKESLEARNLWRHKILRNWDETGAVSDVLWPDSMPYTVIVDPEGRMVATFEGEADWMSPEALKFVDSLLGPEKTKASTSAPAQR